jgi:hypothetical protein
MLLVTINVDLDSFLIITSPITNDGLCVNWEQARGKEWLVIILIEYYWACNNIYTVRTVLQLLQYNLAVAIKLQ